ncbi:MAG: hypothetical protein ACSHXL_02225 [Bacteroidota bacterium]
MKGKKFKFVSVGWALLLLSCIVFAVRHYFSFDWGLSLICGILALPFVKIILMIVFAGAYGLWAIFIYRGQCLNCNTKNVRAGKMCSDPEEETSSNMFMLSECDYCNWQFRKYRGKRQGELISVSPDDPKYIR